MILRVYRGYGIDHVWVEERRKAGVNRVWMGECLDEGMLIVFGDSTSS